MDSPRIVEGEITARDRKVAIVAARFNDFIVSSLLKGAIASWMERGGNEKDLLIARVPGAFELPVAARKLASGGRYDAVVALGCVIRGDTPHFDYVAGEAAKGVAQVSSESGIPVAFGILTTNTVEQAIDRAGAKSGNKGFDAAMTAIEMANLLRTLRQAT